MSKTLFRSAALAAGLALACATAGAAGYRTSVGSGDDAIPLVVVSGSPYEMGVALGALMKAETRALLGRFLAAAQAASPKRHNNRVLDRAWLSISPHMSQRCIDEMRGVAKGAGVPFVLVRRAHMIPAVSDYACSGAALWGAATRDRGFYQFRNLDYTMRGGLQDYPAVVVYVPDKGIPHVNVTFAGVIGSNTGMNAEGIVLTEMGDSPARDYPFDLNGNHFMFMFRDLLYDAHNLDEAIAMIQKTKRIKKYHFIVGDGKNKRAVKMVAHAPDLVIWPDNDNRDEAAPNIRKGVVYNFEGRSTVGWEHVKRNYGRFDAEATIQLSASVASLGGNLMNVVYDAARLRLWVAYAHKRECAFRRAYVPIDLKAYLDVSKVPAGAVVFRGR